MRGRLWLPVLLAPLTGGCVATAVAGAAVAVVKAPFQIAGAGVDAMTTSQEEADRNRGRAERKAEERAAKEAKKAERQAKAFVDDEVCGGVPGDC
jgi:hypothetical protein